MNIKAIQETILEATKRTAEPEVLEHAIGELDELVVSDDSKQLDIIFIKHLGSIFVNGYHSAIMDSDTWRWQWEGISTGKFPLKELPDHVREVAESLYYVA